jgi:hypothetical protein
MRYKYTLSGIQ